MNYVEVYKVVLSFHRKFSKVIDSKGYWENVVSESSQILKRYNGSKFVSDLLTAVVLELERRSKEVKQCEQ